MGARRTPGEVDRTTRCLRRSFQSKPLSHALAGIANPPCFQVRPGTISTCRLSIQPDPGQSRSGRSRSKVNSVARRRSGLPNGQPPPSLLAPQAAAGSILFVPRIYRRTESYPVSRDGRRPTLARERQHHPPRTTAKAADSSSPSHPRPTLGHEPQSGFRVPLPGRLFGRQEGTSLRWSALRQQRHHVALP